eukprot:3376966-Rhodomonas_salina.3
MLCPPSLCSKTPSCVSGARLFRSCLCASCLNERLRAYFRGLSAQDYKLAATLPAWLSSFAFPSLSTSNLANEFIFDLPRPTAGSCLRPAMRDTDMWGTCAMRILTCGVYVLRVCYAVSGMNIGSAGTRHPVG